MNSYLYIESLFKAVLQQSVQIQGRLVILPKKGSELNTDNFDQVIEVANSERKFPIVAMMPPKSWGNFAGSDEWENYDFTLLFLNTTFYDGNNQIKDLNESTQTSGQRVINEWEEMKVAATDFLRVLKLVSEGNNSTGANLVNSIFRLTQKEKYIDPVGFQSTKRLSGVMLRFRASVYTTCQIQDYVDGGLIVLPPVDESTFEAELVVVRNEVLNIITEYVNQDIFQGPPGPAGPAGPTGPQGPAGAAAINYTRRHAFASSNSYIGVAPQGSSEGANVWSITRITVAMNGNTTTAQAVNVNWTNYLTHTYS